MSGGDRARVVFLWHMHQPSYRSPLTGEYLMPWTLVHGMRDYYDMAELACRYPGVKVTLNVVPGLLDQLQDYCRGTARDMWLNVALKEPGALSHDEKNFLLSNFFNVHPETMIRPYPRFAELADKRGMAHRVPRGLSRFSEADWCDLQVYFFLSWAGLSLRRDERVRGLLEKGRGFTGEDKLQLRESVLQQLRKIVPYYGEVHRTGAMEVSCSPMYHPILPLLADGLSAREALPDMRLPATPFLYPEDGRRQVERGLEKVSSLMGAPVRGMWPSEGAVSTRVVRMMSDAGVRWAASDEKLLLGSMGKGAGSRSELIYRPWTLGETTLLFRDAHLSDLIGFTYSRWQPEAAVEHFIGELARAADSTRLRCPVITVAMDGENAWEHYLHGGMRFVELLYERLSVDGRFAVVTPGDVLADMEAGSVVAGRLEGVRSGSWIDGTLRTWIGDPVKNRAWEALLAARQAVAAHLERNHLGDAERAGILDLLDRAEASDWFWWFGEGHSSPYDGQFDLLFRHHLKAVYGAMGVEPPQELDSPLDTAHVKRVAVQMPVHLISPAVTGRDESYYKWLSAGRVVFEQGFFHRPNYYIKELRFGFDSENLYFKVSGSGPMKSLIRERRLELVLHLVRPGPDGVRFRMDGAGEVRAYCERRAGCVESMAEVAVEQSIEIRVPLAALTSGPLAVGQGVEFYLLVLQDGREIERFPTGDNVAYKFRGEELDAENWHV